MDWEGTSQNETGYKFETILHLDDLEPWIRDYLVLLQESRSRIISLLKQIDKDQQLDNPSFDRQRLMLAVENLYSIESLYSNWQNMDAGFEKLSHSRSIHSSFAVRMGIDIYLEFTILTVRVLCDSRAYAIAEKVAHEGIEKMKTRLGDDWKNTIQPMSLFHSDPSGSQRALLSRKALTHQISTLFAWHAYSLYQSSHDTATKVYLIHIGQSRSRKGTTSEIAAICHEALTLRPGQPLACFVQAQLDQERDFMGHAADKFQRLLDTLGYFDPFLYSTQYIADWEALRSTYELDGRSLDYMGLITGPRQFGAIISKAHIHALLAQLFAKQMK